MDMNGIAATTIGSMVDDGIDKEEILDSIMYLFRFSISREQAQNVLTNYIVQRISDAPAIHDDGETCDDCIPY